MLDRHALYEICVQTPDDLVPLLVAIHGAGPRVLGEDFCGSAALSASWVRDVDEGHAVAVDHDREVLARAKARAPGLTTVHGDVVADTSPDLHRVDVLYAGNFSIGECHTRDDLLRYLRHARSRLHDGGVFVCDVYGGETAFMIGAVEREHPGPDGKAIDYTWEQREADPLTGMVLNALHFRIGSEELRDAFVYRWRLWGVPELRDAMREAGLASTEVYPRVPDAVDDDGAAYVARLVDPDELDDSFDVLVVGRVSEAT